MDIFSEFGPVNIVYLLTHTPSKFVRTHPREILAIAVKQDSTALMAAVAPYMVSISVKELCSIGVSNRLVVKWVSLILFS